MDENKIDGTIRNLGGKVEGVIGDLTGDKKLEAEGAADRLAGSAQKMFGEAKDKVRDGVDAIRGKAQDLKSDLQHGGGSQVLDQIEEAGDYIAEQVDSRPVTALLIAAGIGFLIALAAKPAPVAFYRRR